MATMNISLPDAMKDWVEAQSKDGTFSNSSDFVRDLIRRDQQRQSHIANMQSLVDEARAGGASTMTMDDIKQAALERLARSGRANDL